MSTDSETTNDAPLSMSEAIAAYTAEPEQEAEPGQSEAGDEQEGDDLADDELPPDEDGEDEGDPADDEDQADGDEDDDSDENPESDQGRFVSDNAKVRLSDGTVTTIADLKAGSLKNADYTQKTQALASEREAVTVQSTRIKQQETQIAEQAAYVADLIRTIVPAAPDPELLKTDPMAYIAQEASHKQWVAHLTFLDQQKQQATEASQAEATKAEQDKATKEWDALLEKVPALTDPKRSERFVSDIISTGKDYGFTPQELRTVALDHRQALVFKDAIAWRKLQANKAKTPAPKVESRPPVQKGGKRSSPGAAQAREATSAMDRLNKTGSVKDGVAAYLATLSKG